MRMLYRSLVPIMSLVILLAPAHAVPIVDDCKV